MNNINFLKPDKSNLNLFLILGLSLVLISIFDVFLSSFFKINATGFLPTSISFLLPLIIGFIGLHFIRIEYSGIRRLDEINKNFNNNNFNAVLSLLIIFIIIKSIPPVLSWTVIDANISGNSKEACTGDGACWTYIKVWLRRFIYGLYPNEEQWRINLSFISLLALGSVGYFATEKFKNYFDVYTYDLDESKSNDTKENVIHQQYLFLCLPTPMNTDGSCNVDIIERELENIDLIADNHEIVKTIVIKSTIPPGTTEKWNKKYEALDIVFNPEFLTEANAVSDYENQDRIILGGPRPASTDLKRIFSKVFPKARIIKTHSTYAEMVKYTTNTFLSTKVSFANEIYQICQVVGADYDKVMEYATLDKRLGTSHWQVPGHDGDFGFGGHCFPKDLSALLHLTDKFGTINNVLQATKDTNDEIRKDRDWENMKGRAVV